MPERPNGIAWARPFAGSGDREPRGCDGTNFGIDHTDNSGAAAQCEFDGRPGKGGRTQGHPVSPDAAKSATAEARSGFDGENVQARRFGENGARVCGAQRIDAGNAAGGQVGKCKKIFPSDLGIEESLGIEGKQVTGANRGSGPKRLRQRCDRGERGGCRSGRKPGDPLILVVHGGVDQNCSPAVKAQLKPGDVVEREAKDGEPVRETVPGDAAERDRLWKTGIEGPSGEAGIEVFGNEVGRPAAENLSGVSRYLIEREFARLENLSHATANVV